MFGDELQNPLKVEADELGLGFAVDVFDAKKVIVTNSSKIVSMTQNQIKLKAKKHLFVKICGDNLVVEEMQQTMLCIVGKIKSVEFEETK